jgi:cation diffusion facilitator family transporter
MEMYDDIRKAEKGAWLSTFAYILLSAFKLAMGYYGNSEALVADGLNNTTDIIVSIAILIGLRISQKPPDQNHPYGHLRAETIAAMIASFVMASVGIQIVWNAVQSLIHPEAAPPDWITAGAAIVSAIAMYLVYGYNRRLARKLNNRALMAAAHDNLSDAMVSIGVTVGIIGSRIGMPWLDPLAALAVGGLVLKTAWGIFRDASHVLTDGFDETDLEKLRQAIGQINGVQAVKDLRARAHGSNVLIDVVVEVYQDLSVVDSHKISEEIERRLLQKRHVIDVHVHIEPGAGTTK